MKMGLKMSMYTKAVIKYHYDYLHFKEKLPKSHFVDIFNFDDNFIFVPEK